MRHCDTQLKRQTDASHSWRRRSSFIPNVHAASYAIAWNYCQITSLSFHGAPQMVGGPKSNFQLQAGHVQYQRVQWQEPVNCGVRRCCARQPTQGQTKSPGGRHRFACGHDGCRGHRFDSNPSRSANRAGCRQRARISGNGPRQALLRAGATVIAARNRPGAAVRGGDRRRVSRITQEAQNHARQEARERAPVSILPAC